MFTKKSNLSTITIAILLSMSIVQSEELDIDQKISKDIEKRVLEKKAKLNESKLYRKISKLYSDDIQNILDGKYSIDDGIQVKVTLKFDRVKKTTPNESISVTIDNFGNSTIMMDNENIDDKKIKDENEKIKQRSKEYVLNKKDNIRKALKKFKLKNSDLVTYSKTFEDAYIEGYNSFELALSKKELEELINLNKDQLAFVALTPKSVNSIADAMISTNVDPWALNYSSYRGSNIGVYMSESDGCPDNTYISNYMRLGDTAVDNHSELVSSIIREVSPNSYIYCKRLSLSGATLPSSTDRAGYNGNPQVLIESYSFAYYYSTNNVYTDTYSSQDRDWDNEVLDHNMVVFVAAGNNKDFEVASPGKGFNVITVGNYNDATDTIAASSCFGNPETGIEKPEVVAPGEFISAGGHIDSGTSYATPHVAGFTADLFSAYSWLQLRPYLFKSFLLASSTKSISGSSDAVGVGGIDFYNAAYNSTHQWWTGSFSDLAANDSGVNSNQLERTYYLPSGRNVRVAIAWLNDGDYTLANKTIGKDFDLYVYDPNGNYVSSSVSANNSYEVIDFQTTQSGNYRFAVSRFSNHDTSLDMFLSMSINW